MAGPFHHYLRRDAAGKGETNEGAAAGMGANHLIFRESLFDTLASTVASPGDGLIEAGKLAKDLQVPVHQLVRQIGIPEGSENAEAETVPGLLHSAGIFDHLLVLFTIHVQQFDLFAILGNLDVIQVQQLFFGEEDDRLFQDLELWPVGLDGKLMAVSLPDGPVQEPAQVVELLLDALLLQATLVAQVHHKLIDTGLVEIIKGDLGIEIGQVIRKRSQALNGGIGPLICLAFFRDEFLCSTKGADNQRLYCFAQNSTHKRKVPAVTQKVTAGYFSLNL